MAHRQVNGNPVLHMFFENALAFIFYEDVVENYPDIDVLDLQQFSKIVDGRRVVSYESVKALL